MQNGYRRSQREATPGVGIISRPERQNIPGLAVHNDDDVGSLAWTQQNLATVILGVEPAIDAAFDPDPVEQSRFSADAAERKRSTGGIRRLGGQQSLS